MLSIQSLIQKSLQALFIGIILTACSGGDLQVLQSIQGSWEFRQADSSEWLPAAVPGCVHTDLLAAGKIEDPFYRMNEKDLQWIDKKDWEYRTVFIASDEFLKKGRQALEFKGLDTYAKVYLNGQLLLTADNMFREWRADVKGFLKAGENELLVHFDSPIRHGLEKLSELGYALPASNDQSERGELGKQQVSVFTRKAPYHYGWDWGPRFVTSGIWRPVQLVAWDEARIQDLWIHQLDVRAEKATLMAQFTVEASEASDARIAITNKHNMAVLGVREVKLEKGMNKLEIPLEIKNPDIWWTNGLGAQKITSFEGTLYIKNKPVDRRLVKTGLRSLKLVQKPDENGQGMSFYLELNGVPVFMKGANYIPNDNFLNRITDERYRDVVKRASDANMNMLRVWGGGIYENDIFYELCDEYGILLWHDFMFACSMYPGDSLFLANVEEEARQNIIRLRNHPSVALWCGNNEMETAWKNWGWQKDYNEEQKKTIWGTYEKLFHQMLPGLVAELDPGKAYWPSSPSQNTLLSIKNQQNPELLSGDVHNWSVWHGKVPFETYEFFIPRFMSEYGFQSFPELRTIKAFTQPEDWNIESPVMSWHQRSGPGNMLIKTYMDMYYRQPKDFPMFLYLNQVVQAEGVGLGMESHRRGKPWCMGTLYWQHNDCWPAPSWSSTDYYGQWKALHYYARRAYANFMISTTASGDSMKVFVVSDSLVEQKALLRMRILDLDGKELWQKREEVLLPANSSHVYFGMPKNEFLKGIDVNNCFFVAELSKGDRLLASNSYRFTALKNLNLRVPVITHEVKADPAGGFIVSLSTDKPAFNVYLNSESCNGFFSDNYFTLLPGAKKQVHFNPSRECAGFAKDLKILSIRDTY